MAETADIIYNEIKRGSLKPPGKEVLHMNKKGISAIAGLAAVMAAGAVVASTRKKNLQKDEYALWDDSARFYDLKFVNHRKLYAEIISRVRSELDPDMKVLEIATSTGLIARSVAGDCGSIIATDFSEKMIVRAKMHGTPSNLLWDVQDANYLTYPDESFDAVIIVNALEAMGDVETVLEQARRVLNPEGVLIAPNPVKTGSLSHKAASAVKGFMGYGPAAAWTHEEYLQLFEDNGFRVVRDEMIEGKMPVDFVVAEKAELQE